MILRPMTMQDADFLLELKNYPETRQFAIVSHGEIKREDHLKYLEENIQYFQVIEKDGFAFTEYGGSPPDIKLTKDKVGVVRFKDNEVSIWIERRYWGLHIATWFLYITAVGMTAKIVDGNISSMRAFINAGFKPIIYKENYYIFQK